MTPAKLLIAQRLDEVARELEAIAALAENCEHVKGTRSWMWDGHVIELRRAADMVNWWAGAIRIDEDRIS